MTLLSTLVAKKDTDLDFGTGVGQISGADIPIADVGGDFTTDNVGAALTQLVTEKIEIADLSTALADYLLLTGGTISSDLTVQGDFTVTGTTTTIDTDTVVTDQMSITNTGTGPALIVNQTGSQPVVDFQDDGTSAFYIEDGGFVGMGTSDPARQLDLVSNTDNFQIRLGTSNVAQTFDIGRSGSTGKLTFYSNQTSLGGYEFGGIDGTIMTLSANGNCTINGTCSATDFNSTSLRAMKENIRDYSASALELIKATKIVAFDFIDGPKDKVGFVADDTDSTLSTKNNDSMDHSNSIGVLMKGMQELMDKLDTMTSRMDAMEASA